MDSLRGGVDDQALPQRADPPREAAPPSPDGELAPWSISETPWSIAQRVADSDSAAHCNICDWEGDTFEQPGHSERGVCPRCGSIARDRFLVWCFVARTTESRFRVLETSPRLGPAYRSAMDRWFDYRASDFDERAHKTDLKVDLQDTQLPDDSLDIILTPHVLEHVPETASALAELYRITAPGGRVCLQIPMQQGQTAPPVVPEFHGDNTPVFWRFGFDLIDPLRAVGFETRLLCSEEFYRYAETGLPFWPEPVSPEFDLESILEHVRLEDLDVVLDRQTAKRLALYPAYMFLGWDCAKPAS